MAVTLDVLCVGVATVDTIARVSAMPGADERVLSEPFVIAGGGPAATAAVALARLGKRVGFCGVVGDDEAGRLARNSFELEGVDTTWLVTRPGVVTAQSLIIVSGASASRAIITTSSAAPSADDIPTDVATWIHADQNGYAATREALASRPTESLLSVDGGNPIAGLNLAGVDLYAPTLEALAALFPGTPDTSLRAAAAAGAGTVVATNGASGTYALIDDTALLVDAFAVTAVSTMGAGDVFHGALLAAVVDGAGLADAVRLANATAALSCLALDGRSGIPSRAEVEQFLTGAESGDRV